jgi:hypothetical protein
LSVRLRYQHFGDELAPPLRFKNFSPALLIRVFSFSQGHEAETLPIPIEVLVS